MFPTARQLLLSATALLSIAADTFASPLAESATVVNKPSGLKKKYDYIVIGGGTSGLTVANRLTENPRISVLVIEYGPIDRLQPEVLVPGLPMPQEYHRDYQSIPQPGLKNRPQTVYSAAVVGGGTVINGMFFNRGSARDYDGWEKLGNPGWGWKGLLPYFKKSETFTPPPPELAKRFPISSDFGPHGKSGPIGSSFPEYQYPVLKYFFPAWNQVGVPSNPQPNGGRAVGAFYSPLSLTAKNQSRSSASTGYYRPIAGKRSNYHLIPEHSVSKILIDKNRKVATGVEFTSSKDTKTKTCVEASREVILAAGAPRSPGLLQLSGVGPQKLLKGLGIKVIEDLPGVGYNFQDQPSFFAGVTYAFNKYPFPSPSWIMSNKTWADQQLAIYYKNRTGPYTQPYLSGTTVAFLPLQSVTEKYRDIVNKAKNVDLKKALPAGADSTLLKGYKAQQDLLLEDYKSPDTAVHEAAAAGGETIPLVHLKPLSRGSILINSTNPLAPPVIDYGTFQHRTDVDILIEIVKKFRKFVAAKSWQSVGIQETNPGLTVQADSAIEDTLRQQSASTWSHPVGTCGMLPKDKGGVVDSKLRVYGIKKLRVVDGSIMPLIPASHTSSTVYAVAEKAADLIKADQ